HEHPSPAADVDFRERPIFAKGLSDTADEFAEENRFPPLPTYNAVGGLRQDPGRAPKSLADAKTAAIGGMCQLEDMMMNCGPSRATWPGFTRVWTPSARK